MKAIDNEKLIEALKESKAVFAAIQYYNCDDEQLAKIQKFNNLTQFEKDLMYLTCTMKAVDVAKLYGVSRQYIYKVLNQIKQKL